jgi:hypothetical protein
MLRRTLAFSSVCVVVFGLATAALAQESTPTEMPPAEAAAPPPAAAPDMGAPAAAEPLAEPAPEAGTVTSTAATTEVANAAKYGVAFRFRWVTVPGWFLKLFTVKNQPLSSYSYALEGYRRKRDKDDPNRTWELVVGIGYQNMSPSDGYWLGKGKDPTVDADLVQFRNFGLITMDAAFVSRQYFSRYFGIHYGAGLGLAVVRGKVLRTSAQYDGQNYSVHQAGTTGGNGVICTADAKCNEALLVETEGRKDNGPGDPHRFQENSIPGAVPIINLLFGLDFPIPDAKGLEFRVEGGFFDAFFLGGTMGYVF